MGKIDLNKLYNTPILQMGGSPAGGNTYLGEKHLLKIINRSEDVGQDDYMEDYDYEFQHPYECEKQMRYKDDVGRYYRIDVGRYYRIDDSTYQSHYVCPMAEELAKHGLQRLQMNWLDLEVGEYWIILEQANSQMYAAATSGSGYPPPEIPKRIVLL